MISLSKTICDEIVCRHPSHRPADDAGAFHQQGIASGFSAPAENQLFGTAESPPHMDGIPQKRPMIAGRC
jgi:hypothetical protein